jgi:hypothetical protein
VVKELQEVSSVAKVILLDPMVHFRSYTQGGNHKGLSRNYDPTQNRATTSEEGLTWVAPTSYVGVAQRQEARTIRHQSYCQYIRQGI